jgi:hypothetical protein
MTHPEGCAYAANTVFDNGMVRRDNRLLMDVTLAVLADYANTSKEGKLNILGVFSEINPPFLPLNLPQMYVVVSMEAGTSETGIEMPFRILLWDGDGKEILNIEQKVLIPTPSRAGARATINNIIGLAGVPFNKPGEYAFYIHVAGEEKRRIAFRVNEPPERSAT